MVIRMLCNQKCIFKDNFTCFFFHKNIHHELRIYQGSVSSYSVFKFGKIPEIITKLGGKKFPKLGGHGVDWWEGEGGVGQEEE